MKVKLISHTASCIPEAKNLEELIVYCARVSNPNNQENMDTAEKLIKYLLRNKHFSPFEMVNICLEINTTRDIAHQIIRHRSFQFQEFCIAKGSLIDVLTESGINEQVPIEDLYLGYESSNYITHVYCGDTKQLLYAKIKEVFKTGEKECFKVVVEDKKTLESTKEHKFLTKKGFKQLKSINVGDYIAVRDNKKSIAYKKVVNIESVGIKETYDIEIAYYSHNYVANGIVVHNSQRYADPTNFLGFETKEARLQDSKNRQNSLKNFDDALDKWWLNTQMDIWDLAVSNYSLALEKGIAKEVARSILPEGNTKSRLYMNGTLRSWIHYLQVRHDQETQQEHREIAYMCIDVIATVFPLIKEILKV
jgi:thymidylate synthase ThyX